jgi:hypothetical protein
MSTVKRPPSKPITPNLMYPDTSKNSTEFFSDYYKNLNLDKPNVPDLYTIRKHLFEEGSVGKAELIKLIKDTTQLMSKFFSCE